MRFRAAPPSLLLLLPALLTTLHRLPAAAYVLSNADTKVTAMLRMFNHVLSNDHDWRLVLDQKVLVSVANRPRYGTHCDDGDLLCATNADHVHDPQAREMVRLLDAGETEVTAGAMLQRVVNRFAWLGSHVQYAAYVLRTALTCATYTFVSLQIDLLVMREKTAPQPTRTDDQWAQLAVFTDKLAGAFGDLRLLAGFGVLLKEFDDPRSPYGHHKAYLLGLFKEGVDAAVDHSCARVEPNDVFARLGVRADHSHLVKDMADGDPNCILKAYEQTSVAVMAYYDGLNIVATDLTEWMDVLEFGTPILAGVNFNMKLDDMLKKDEVGRQILMEKWHWPSDTLTAGHKAKVVDTSVVNG